MTEERMRELVAVMQTKFTVFITKDGTIELRDFYREHAFKSFPNWEDCEAWVVDQEWNDPVE